MSSAFVPGRIWPQLPRELAERIASCLSQNEVACTLRLVNKAAAEQFRGPQCTKVLLSQPTPAHEFAWRWGDPGATRPLTYKQRIQLLCLTAASGSIPNMKVALVSAGCLPTGKVFCAAAAAGQLHMCEWLLEQDCPCDDGALEAAAQAGQRDVCMWLLEKGLVPSSRYALRAYHSAACGGHLGLMEELLQLYPFCPSEILRPPQGLSDRMLLLAGVAEGCDLATLQRLHHEWLEAPAGEGEQEEAAVPGKMIVARKALMVEAAAGSPTPDWRAKVEWLEGRGYHCSYHAVKAAAGRPDAVERLEWFQQRGRTLTVLLGLPVVVAYSGNLDALKYLHGKGVPLIGVLKTAVEKGHLEAVAWLFEVCEPKATPDLLHAAAVSGSVELLAWLRSRGCPWAENMFARAAGAGNEAALEWLVEQGCPMAVDGSPYEDACANNDVATLRCLVRLGCPWGPDGKVFDAVLRMTRWRVRLVMLYALLLTGCPVDCEAAEAGVRSHVRGPDQAKLLAMLTEERERRQRAGQERQRSWRQRLAAVLTQVASGCFLRAK